MVLELYDMGSFKKRKKQLIEQARELGLKNLSKKIKLRNGSIVGQRRTKAVPKQKEIEPKNLNGPSIPPNVLAKAALDKKRANEKKRNLRGELNLLKATQKQVS